MVKYYLRWRGEVTGPFDGEEVVSLLHDGKVSKHHQISADRLTWEPISQSDAFRGDCRPATDVPPKTMMTAVPIPMEIIPEVVSIKENGSQEEPGRLRLQSHETQGRLGPPAVWYVTRGDSVEGPFTEHELREQKARNLLNAQSLLCRENEQVWISMGELFPELFVSTAATLLPTAISASEMISYAGFISRFAAAFIDGIILASIDFMIMLIVNFISPNPINYRREFVWDETWAPMVMLYNIWNVILTWLYFTLSESSGGQATLGKKALGLVVTDEAGRRISFGRANGRYFGKIVSGLLLCIGYLMAAFTDRKQALHDIMAGTLVLKKVKFLAPLKEPV